MSAGALVWAIVVSASGEHVPEAKEHAVKATVYFDQKKYSNAAKEFEAALKLDPAWVDLWFNAGVAHEAAGELSDAVAAFRNYLPHAAGKEADEVQTRVAKLEIQLEEETKRAAEEKATAQKAADDRERNQGIHFKAEEGAPSRSQSSSPTPRPNAAAPSAPVSTAGRTCQRAGRPFM